jgi:predicted DCC family thiol-disulfide oxidoreductase YuxK
MGTPDTIGHALVLFDGVCNLCNHSVKFIIKRDSKAKFRFASLQSEVGQQKLSQHAIPIIDNESIVVIKNRKVFQKSNAALEIARGLDGAWPILYGLKVVPRFIRDFFYDLIARNRYKMFGRQNECMIPTPELKARFVD